MLEPYRETGEAALAAIWQLSVRPIRSRSRDDPPAARADPHELLDNARKYTPAGGREEMGAQGGGEGARGGRSLQRRACFGGFSPASGGGADRAGAQAGGGAGGAALSRARKERASMAETQRITVTVNGTRYEREVEPRLL